ncbi:MAG: helicase C-terminal domain-containing protein [bacterium]|nr:helicase C-terminal domain-containing protein [bacterium]
MEFSLANRTASLSVGEFANFALGPHESGGGPSGLWRAQLGQHWHNELQIRTQAEAPAAQFEVVIDGRLTHRGWTFHLNGRIDQLVGDTFREIKSVTRPLPADEATLRADYPPYFLQLAAYLVLFAVRRHGQTPGGQQPATVPRSHPKAELIFVEAGSGLSQTITLTPFDEALVHHQLDAIVEFLNLRQRATERRRSLTFHPAFATLRPGQETIQADLASSLSPPASVLFFEAPTGYGKTGCVLEFALGQMRAGRFARLIWLTGKSTGQLQVVRTLEQMTAGSRLAFWQVRNKAEHCVNHTFHCVRDGCNYLRDCAERWPGSGLAKFYLDDAQPHDLATLRQAGRDALICPYEITRTALAFNDVWIGDFNYVFAPDNRGLFYEQPGFDPAETLLVIDEAHNLPSRTADAHSHSASQNDAHTLLAELDHLRAPSPLLLALEEWTRLLASLQPADSLDPTLEAEVHDTVVKLADLVATQPLDYAALGPHHAETLWQFAALAEFLDDSKLTKLLWVPRAGELSFTCIDAAASIGETLKAYGGAILMSATLQPYDTLAAACGIEVEPDLRAGSARPEVGLHSFATLSAPTPWRAGAYDVAVDVRVDTTFKQRASYYGTTAATIESLHAAASVVGGVPSPRAVAVFFPSYAYAESVQRALDNSGSVLRVTLQPRGTDLAAQAAWVEENLALADVLFLVLGSSFAEGIDLLGGRVTHAMVVGPALPEVNAIQKARLAAFNELGRDAAFRRVYQIPGLQKVNQALGRLVRAPGQHAKVLLHCRRFAEISYASLLAADYQQYQEIASESDLREWLGA